MAGPPQDGGQQPPSIPEDAQDPIAIVGMSCRLPGQVNSPSSLWKMLLDERAGQCDVPKTRFNIDGFYKPEIGMDMRGGYFIKDDIREFDNEFFGILNQEATYMDPQQRKLLEVVFECFESAGVTLDQISGSDTGCYVGNFGNDYLAMQTKDPENFSRFSATGMGATLLANRISHTFNMEGPSLVIDTACSSSLYCLHMACAALESGDCKGAIVAGANLIQSVEQHLGMMKAGVLSKTSTCHTFDDSADGYARADGLGSLYLKRLSDAVKDNDPIRAVIRGTAIGSNGRTRGISAPSADAQVNVIRKAYERAALDPSETSFIECHGTGTRAGDPLEVEALSKVFKSSNLDPLMIGSIKTNVGHSEAVSGLSGIIKAVLVLEQGRIPPTVGLKKINPKIKVDEWGIDIVTKTKDWPEGKVRRTGVNSFGYGGANGHVILEAADAWTRRARGFTPPAVSLANSSFNPTPADSLSTVSKSRSSSEPEILSLDSASSAPSSFYERNSFLLPFSATTEKSLEARIIDTAQAATENLDVVDLAYTLGCRRTHFTQQRGYIVGGRDTLLKDLDIDNLRTLPSPPAHGPLPFAFIFTGQGAQWPGMGKQLFEEFPVFRRSIQEMDTILTKVPHPPDWTIQGTLYAPAETSQIQESACAQPVSTALQIATMQLLYSWGIIPKYVVGHSSGEVAAAFAAGHATEAEAIVAAFYRGYCNGINKLEGAMMAVGMGSEEGEAEIAKAGLQGKVVVACVNSPVSITMSGDAAHITSLSQDLQSRGIFARKLGTGGKAYHSHHMKALGPELQRLIPEASKNLPPNSPRLRTGATFVSSVTGKPKSEGIDATYWRTNMESPVLFAQAAHYIITQGDVYLLEIGPHSALELPLKQIRTKAKKSSLPYSNSLSRGKNAVDCALGLVGQLFLHGYDCPFFKVNDAERETGPKVIASLPPYSQTYESLLWNEPRASRENRSRKYPRHELLGSHIPGGDGQTLSWRNLLEVKDLPWIDGHRLEENVVLPGACYLAMAIEAVSQATQTKLGPSAAFEFQNVSLPSSLALPLDSALELFTSINPKRLSSFTKSSEWWRFEIVSYQEEGSTTHATGSIRIRKHAQELSPKISHDGTLKGSGPFGWYGRFARAGVNFSSRYQTLQSIETDKSGLVRFARTTAACLRDNERGARYERQYAIHPITMDAMLQSGMIANAAGSSDPLEAKTVISMESAIFRLPRSSEPDCVIKAQADAVGLGSVEVSAELECDGQICAKINQVRMSPYLSQNPAERTPRHPMLKVAWKPDIYTTGWATGKLAKYIDGMRPVRPSDNKDIIMRVISLAAHKNPGLRILELVDADTCETLTDDVAFTHPVGSFTAGYLSGEGELWGLPFNQSIDPNETYLSNEGSRWSPPRHLETSRIEDQKYNIVVLPNAISADLYLHALLPRMKSLLASEYSFILADLPGTQNYRFAENGFSTLQANYSLAHFPLILARPVVHDKRDTKNLVIVERDGASDAVRGLSSQLSAAIGESAKIVKLSNVSTQTISKGAPVISLLEAEEAMLATLDSDQMSLVKVLTNNASTLLWMTGGGLLGGGKPEFGMALGVQRAVSMEQPSLGFYNFDVDQSDLSSPETVANLLAIYHQQSIPVKDREFFQKEGMVHVSRFVPRAGLNRTLRQRSGNEPALMTLRNGKYSMKIEKPGHFDTICFEKDEISSLQTPPLAAGHVEVLVQTVGLNSRDIDFMRGKIDSRNATASQEFCGIVTETGADGKFSIGDRVVVMAPGHFNTHEIVPEWACVKLEGDNPNVACTLPVVYATALYALHYRAHLQPQETVLIHCGASDIGMAAIQLAQMAGAEIFTTAGTSVRRQFLIDKFNLKPENVFSSRDNSYYQSVLAVQDRGIDVILNQLLGDHLHDSWRLMAPFGRFVELGRKELVDTGKLDMDVFKRDATFSAVDLSSLYHAPAGQKTWTKLITQVMTLYREGVIHPIEPLETFEISDLPKALKRYAQENRLGKVSVSFENPNALVKVRPPKHVVKMASDKWYILVGCLGGLGRSISKYMMTRGARNFIFMGRSGIDRERPRQQVEELEDIGATVKVIRGDVTKLEDVQRAVDAAEGPIGGVVQAAMALGEALFAQMPNDMWHTCIDPKMLGSFNLHQAIKGKDSELDFFFMTSSVSGSVGQAAQANYCSGNFFLDMFARHRRAQGLPATAIGFGMISDVGYLHENPDVERVLRRSGITALDEKGLLQIMDIALSSAADHQSTAVDSMDQAHILTGLESYDPNYAKISGFDAPLPGDGDPRTSILAAARAKALEVQGVSEDDNKNEDLAAASADLSPVEAAIANIRARFAKQLSTSVEKISETKPISGFGLDSMMGTEFRTWYFQSYKVDIAFDDLVEGKNTITSLAEKALNGV